VNTFDGTHQALYRPPIHYAPDSVINDFAFRSDDRVMVSGHGLPYQFSSGPVPPGGSPPNESTQDNYARVWDVRGGTLLYELPHKGPVYAVAYSPDGKTVVTGSGTLTSDFCYRTSCTTTVFADNAVRIWRMTDGQLDKVLALNQPHEVTAVAFSPDGSVVASGTADGSIRFWDVATGSNFRTLHLSGEPLQIAFTPDSAFLRVRYSHEIIWSWRVSDGERVGAIPGFALSPDGTLVAQAPDAAHAKLEIRRAADAGIVKAFDREVAGVTDLAFSRDGQFFSYVRSDGQLITANLFDPPVKGDLNGDRLVDVQDAVTALEIVVGLADASAVQLAAGDVNGDGRIDVTDVALILQVAVGLRADFEAHPPRSDDFFTGLGPFWKAKQPFGDTPFPPPTWDTPDRSLLSLTSANNDLWLGTWEPYFLYQDGLFGDFTMRVTVHSVPECGDLSAVGLMVAQGVPNRISGPESIPSWGAVFATRDYGPEAKWGGKGRSETSFPASIDPGMKPPYRLRLDRRGSILSFYASGDGNAWNLVAGPVDLAARGWTLGDPVSAGIVEQTHCGSGVLGTATVSQFVAGPLDAPGQ
jgi:hypothetical protein